MKAYEKPLPKPSKDTKEFWEGCKRGELLMQRCTDCGTYRFFPRPMCHACNSLNLKWSRVSGKGKVFSWVVCNRAFHPAFSEDVPYIVVNVQLYEQEDLRISGPLVGVTPEDTKPSMPVEVFFDRVTEDFTLPKWKPANSPGYTGLL